MKRFAQVFKRNNIQLISVKTVRKSRSFGLFLLLRVQIFFTKESLLGFGLWYHIEGISEVIKEIIKEFIKEIIKNFLSECQKKTAECFFVLTKKAVSEYLYLRLRIAIVIQSTYILFLV